MSWFKIDDGFHCHPKVLEAGNEAIGLYVRCGSYSSQQLTEGFVPRVIALMYGDTHLIDALVKVGLFKPVDGGWLIHDYGVYNPTREQVLGEREAAKQRQRNARERARQAREDAKRKAAEGGGDSNRHAVSHGVTSAVTHGVSHISSDAHNQDRHGVTHASLDANSQNGHETATAAATGPVDESAGHSDSADASRRDFTRESRSPRPDPTRPVLPTEVRNNTTAPAALFGDDPADTATAADKPQPQGRESNSQAKKSTAPKSGKPQSGSGRGTRIPEDFALTEEMREWGRKHCPHIKDPEEATAEFVDYWLSEPGAKAKKLDWVRTWQNRMRELERRARDRLPAQRNGTIPSPRPSTTTRIVDQGVELIRKMAEEDGVDLGTLIPVDFSQQRRELTA